MTLGEQETQLLAELKDMPSFVLLIGLLKEFEEDVLGEVALSKHATELVRITRFYQCLRAIREFMESRPQAAASELDRIKKTYFAESELGPVGDIFQQRFSPGLENNVV